MVFETELIDTTCAPLGIPDEALTTAPFAIPAVEDKFVIIFEPFVILPVTETIVVLAGIISPCVYNVCLTVKLLFNDKSLATARRPFIETSPFNNVLPATNKLLLKDASFFTNNRVFMDTSSITRKMSFMLVLPANNVFPATSKVYKYPFSSKSTLRWSSLPMATTPAYVIITVPRPIP